MDGVLLAHPALVADCPPWRSRTCTVAAASVRADQSVEVVGLWAQAHADEAPVLDVDYYQANRGVYRELARKMGSQYPPHLEALEQAYLVLADGRCALPVAYSSARMATGTRGASNNGSTGSKRDWPTSS